MRFRIAPRLPRCDDAIAELQRRPRDGILGGRKLRARTPFEVPGLRPAVLHHLDANERVRVPPDELLDDALDLDALARLVGRRKRMMGEDAACAGDHDEHRDDDECNAFHAYLPPRLLYAASMNISVVHAPVAWPNRGS